MVGVRGGVSAKEDWRQAMSEALKEIKRATKKPVTISYIVWNGTEDDLLFSCFVPHQLWCRNSEGQPCIKTLDSGPGFHVVSPGDHVIQGVKGEFYACKPDIFTATYSAEAALSRSVGLADYLEAAREYARENTGVYHEDGLHLIGDDLALLLDDFATKLNSRSAPAEGGGEFEKFVLELGGIYGLPEDFMRALPQPTLESWKLLIRDEARRQKGEREILEKFRTELCELKFGKPAAKVEAPEGGDEQANTKDTCHVCGMTAKLKGRLGNNKLRVPHNCPHGKPCAAGKPTAGLHINHNIMCSDCMRLRAKLPAIEGDINAK